MRSDVALAFFGSLGVMHLENNEAPSPRLGNDSKPGLVRRPHLKVRIRTTSWILKGSFGSIPAVRLRTSE